MSMSLRQVGGSNACRWLAYSSSEEIISEDGHSLPTIGRGSASNSDSSGPPGDESWNGSCTKPDSWTKDNDKKSCPDLE